MAKRITETVYIFANNQVVGSYMVPKPKEKEIASTEQLQISRKSIMDFYKNWNEFYNIELELLQNKNLKEGPNNFDPKVYNDNLNTFYDNLITYYNINLPLNAIKMIIDNNKDSNKIDKELELFQKDQESFLRKINTHPTNIKIPISAYTNTLRQDFNKLLNLKHNLYTKNTKMSIEDFNIYSMITLYPVLNNLQTLYFNAIFNKYVKMLFAVKRHHIHYATYMFIKKYLHFECTNKNDEARRIFVKQFERLKDIKLGPDDKYILSVNNKHRLYKFIVCLKTYYKLVVDLNCDFLYNGTLVNKEKNEWLEIIYHRIHKKYFHHFFGKNTNFDDYTMEELCLNLESKVYQVKPNNKTNTRDMKVAAYNLFLDDDKEEEDSFVDDDEQEKDILNDDNIDKILTNQSNKELNTTDYELKQQDITNEKKSE